jgi:hypothetical protein
MKNFFGFGSSTPKPPPPPTHPPAPLAANSAPPKAGSKESPSASSPLVGQWKEPNGNDITEFRADGTVVEKPAGGETIRGSYSFDGTKLKIKLEGLPEELPFLATVKQDALEMKDRDGQVTRYRRVGA